MNLVSPVTLSGRIIVRAHPSGWSYERSRYRRGRLLHDDHNTITSAGKAYLCNMLLADPLNDPQRYGITQIGLKNTVGIEVHKADVTDQFVSGSSIISILYLTSVQPAAQPVDLNAATLYLDDGGTTVLATGAFNTITKTNLLALTLEWTVTIA